MPRDVATRWNSTYDMLAFAVEYNRAIKTLTLDIDSKLTDFQLSAEEWGYAGELARALKVCVFPLRSVFLLTNSAIDLQRYNTTFF